MMSPNPQCVLNMIKEPELKNTSEQLIFDYLHRFILSLKSVNF